ncbi:pentapeptide repeat-containing protein, partial [Frankia sp. CiP1_Cm_nod2]|uniref:pentapeptide repeat-containing protein n=1 Tax=Frankia sp. CiP1_Cm_nod2 TaxID=2897161 RepID=UPI002025462B
MHHNPVRGAASDDENLRDADDLDRILGPHLNLLLHGHTHDGRAGSLPVSGLPVVSTGSAAAAASARPSEVANQYQLIRIDRAGFTRYARRYEPDQRRWTGDPRIDPAGGSWSVRTRHEFRSVHAAFPRPAGDGGGESEPGRYRSGWRRDGRFPDGRSPDGPFLDDDGPSGERRYGEPAGPRPPDLLDEIAEVARLRHPDARVDRVEKAAGDGGPPAHLRLWRAEGRIAEHRIVGLLDGDADAAGVDEFARTVRHGYLAAHPGVFTDLVYTGAQAAPGLVAHAERLGMTLLSRPEYQGVLDLRDYVRRQTVRLRTDVNYPPELYVPQRIRRVGRTPDTVPGTVPDTVPGTALDQIIEWLTTDEARFVLVLGEPGYGKTFLTHELALKLPGHLPHVDPMLIELGRLEKSLELDQLVAQHLVESAVRRPDLDAFRYMLGRGRLVLICDGFDELAARVTYERAVEDLDALLDALDGRAGPDTPAAAGQAKILVTSRAEFFLTDDEVLKKTGEKVARTFGRYIVRLTEFTSGQIHDFLVGRYDRALSQKLPDPGSRRAEARRLAADRLALIEEVRDLPDLAHNPRLLSFIADLDEDRLRRARRLPAGTATGEVTGEAGAGGPGAASGASAGTAGPAKEPAEGPDGASGTVTAADLYRELIGQWLAYEHTRSRELTVDERGAAVTELAVTLWRDGAAFVGVARLTEIAGHVLRSMRDPRSRTADETAHLLGSGTALRRDADGRFAFIHQSVMEYLVAAEIARVLTAPAGRGGHAGDLLAAQKMSELMADFFTDLAGRDAAARWAQNTVTDAAAPAVAKANAELVARRLGVRLRTGADLAGADLAGEDLSGQDLRDADLRRANLTDARLDRADLRGADLRAAVLAGASLKGTRLDGADLSEARLTGATLSDVAAEGVVAHEVDLDGARISGGVLRAADLTGASMRQARVTGAELTGVDLTGADLSGTRFVDTDLTGATLTGSNWSRAAFLGGRLGPAVDAPELATAALAGRDRAQVMPRPAASPQYAVAFSPD